MTEVEIQRIIETKSLPKDELDDFWDNMFGLFPFLLLLIVTKDNILFLLLTISIVLYFFFLRMNERNIKAIDSVLTREENIILLEKVSENEKWLSKTVTDGYYEYYIPFLFRQPGHKLTILLIENEVFFNLRNVGTSKGRIPFLFGIDTIKERRIINLLKYAYKI